MNVNNKFLGKIVSIFRKDLTILYFIFFILLNLLDFFGKLQGDLDFFKKLISWTIIWIIFYKASFSKIFFGEKNKTYDILYIIVFSLFSIPRILKFYFLETNNHFEFFTFLTTPLTSILQSTTPLILFFFPLLFLILLNVTVLEKTKISSKGFLGSLQLKETFFKNTLLHASLFMVTLFFAFIICPFFLEWFALSVDALILILGLIFYTYLFLKTTFYKKEEENNKLLNKISNTGNSFFIFIVKSFSNKNTFFIGVSFLLTLHLLVDIGIYMIPSLIGNYSGLYGSEISSSSLFNLISFTNSVYYSEIHAISQSFYFPDLISKGMYILFSFLIYLGYFIYFFSLLFFPFYFVYKHLKEKKINLNKTFIVFIITFTLFSFLITGVFNSAQSPLKISAISSETGVKGIDIAAQTVLKQNGNGEVLLKQSPLDYYSTFILFLIVIAGFILFRFEKYKTFFIEVTHIIFLLFFVFYIFSYYTNINSDNFSLFEKQNIQTYGTQIPNFDVNKKITTNGNSVSFKEKEFNFNGKLYSQIKPKLTYFIGEVSKDSIVISSKFIPQNKLGIKNSKETLEFLKGNQDSIKAKIIINEKYEKEIGSKQEQNTAIQTLKSLFVKIPYEEKKDVGNIFFKSLLLFFSTLFYIVGGIVFTKHFISNIQKEIK